jgi:putative transposase
LYYEPRPESALNLEIMRKMDEIYLEMPFYGVVRMTVALQGMGYPVHERRVRRLMRLMGLEALYPKPRTSIPDKSHTIYPYLLRGMSIEYPNQVWATDITYIPMQKGFAYLMAIMDWYSRFILSWRVSTSLDVSFCLYALEEALARYLPPEIFNMDQGSQFTSNIWVERLLKAGIRPSMDGRGRYLDNIFVERLWRTAKYENIYPMNYGSVPELKEGLKTYLNLYNNKRIHTSLANEYPADVYFGRVKI